MNVKCGALTKILFVVYLLILTGIVLFKLPFYSPALSDGIRVINWIPLKGSFNENDGLLLREMMYNILIYVPMGIYICMLKRDASFLKKALAVLSISFLFEALQFIFALGRTDITDLLNNTLGGLAGIGISAVFDRVFRGKAVKTINMAALVLTIIVAWRFGYLFYLSHFAMRR